MTIRFPALVAAAMLFSGSGHATALITFEELPAGLVAMSNSPGAAAPAASHLTNQYLVSDGVSFTSLAGYAAVVDHGAGNPSASVPNIIGGTASGGALDYNAPITISFFLPSSISTRAVTSFFKIQGDYFPLGSGGVNAQAFDVSGHLLGSTSDTDNKAFGLAGPVLTFNLAGIHSVVISGNNGTVGFDNLDFGPLTAAVPEPSTYALMLSGLGLMACSARRRRG